MYHLLGLKECIRNVAILCKPYFPNQVNRNELKEAYKKFLEKSQSHVPRFTEKEISFLHKPQDIGLLLQIFEEESFLDDFEDIFDLSKAAESSFQMNRIKEAFAQIQNIDSGFYDLVQLVINIIFSAPSKLAGGGSTSAAIGCIWANIRNHWQCQDILEFLVHETTHNLVFLDELCHKHYSNYSELPKTENFAWSAILNKLRPLDKVFHSIIVSTEVLLFREQTFGHPDQPCLHPPSSLMIEQTLNSVNYLNERSDLKALLSKRANLLLENCYEKLKTLEQVRGMAYSAL
jgi:hypothetical protein